MCCPSRGFSAFSANEKLWSIAISKSARCARINDCLSFTQSTVPCLRLRLFFHLGCAERAQHATVAGGIDVTARQGVRDHVARHCSGGEARVSTVAHAPAHAGAIVASWISALSPGRELVARSTAILHRVRR